MQINKFDVIRQVSTHFRGLDTPPPDRVVIFPETLQPITDDTFRADLKTIVGTKSHVTKIAFAVKDGRFVPSSWQYVG